MSRRVVADAVAAEHQRIADIAQRVPRQRFAEVLRRVVEAVHQRTRESGRHTERAARSEEAGAVTGEGELPLWYKALVTY